MIRVLFFARLREQLGASEIEVTEAEAGESVDSLLASLRARGEPWAEALAQANLLCAVNQEQVDRSHAVGSGDEVAFFPPVTGG